MTLHFKFDENLDPRWREPLEKAGHTVSTAGEENLLGSDDPVIADVCRREKFCLVTADLDFSQILNYPPERYNGILVLRHPKPTLAGMKNLIQEIVVTLHRESPTGRLWIIEPGRIRFYP